MREIRLPNGKVISGVPDTATKEEVMAKAIKAGHATYEDFGAVNPATGYGGLPFRPFGVDTGLTMPESVSRGFAGAGSMITDLAQGAQQLTGSIDQQAVRDKSALDAPLRDTAGGTVGALGAAVALPLVAAMSAPGAATVAGGAAIGGAMGLLSPVPEGDVLTGKAKNTALSAALGGAGNYAGGLIGNRIARSGAEKAAKAAAAKVAGATANETRRAAQQLGFVVPPTHANPTIANRLLEGTAGKLTTQQLAAETNQTVLDAIAKRTLGIADDAPLSMEAIQSVRRAAGGAYDALKSVKPSFAADAQYIDDLAAITGKNGILSREFPSLATKDVDDFVAGFLRQDTPSDAAIEAIKQLRSNAKVLYRSDEPAKRAMAQASRSVADAMEGMIERNLQQSGDEAALQAFRSARELIAKSHSIEDALNEGSGHVVARKLASQLGAGRPLTGDLKAAAKFAQAHPRATQEITTSMPGVSPIDVYGAGGLAALMQNPLPLLVPPARMAIRSGILSAPYQAAMTVPKYSGGGLQQMIGGLLASKGGRASASIAAPLIYGQQ